MSESSIRAQEREGGSCVGLVICFRFLAIFGAARHLILIPVSCCFGAARHSEIGKSVRTKISVPGIRSSNFSRLSLYRLLQQFWQAL
jgi:hypothetical protein